MATRPGRVMRTQSSQIGFGQHLTSSRAELQSTNARDNFLDCYSFVGVPSLRGRVI